MMPLFEYLAYMLCLRCDFDFVAVASRANMGGIGRALTRAIGPAFVPPYDRFSSKYTHFIEVVKISSVAPPMTCWHIQTYR